MGFPDPHEDLSLASALIAQSDRGFQVFTPRLGLSTHAVQRIQRFGRGKPKYLTANKKEQ